MKEFTQDGMFNELSKVTRAINRKKYESMDLPRYNLGGSSCPDGLEWDETLQQCVNITNLNEVSVTPVSRHVATYEETNPFQDFFAKKKADYIRKAGNFGKLTDLESNFPEAQIKKIRDEYEYLRNNYVAKKLGHNYNDREKWVDKLSASEREVLQNSEFASKLRPSLWAKTKAGLIGLGNTMLPGQPLAYDVKGLSPKEEAEYKKNKLAALDATSFVDLPGAVISNALSNSREYASNPGIFSGEIVNDAGELGAGLLNPLLPLEIGTGVSLAPDLIELGLKGAQGAFKAGKKLSRGLTVDDVPLELPGSPNQEELVDLWRIQEREARPMSELAAEGKLGKHFQNEKAIKHFKDREEHFGQWFTKDKNDFDFYNADREFIDPEIINLKVPASKLESYSQYNKSLSRAPEREFVVPFEEQSLYRQSDDVSDSASAVDNIDYSNVNNFDELEQRLNKEGYTISNTDMYNRPGGRYNRPGSDIDPSKFKDVKQIEIDNWTYDTPKELRTKEAQQEYFDEAGEFANKWYKKNPEAYDNAVERLSEENKKPLNRLLSQDELDFINSIEKVKGDIRKEVFKNNNISSNDYFNYLTGETTNANVKQFVDDQVDGIFLSNPKNAELQSRYNDLFNSKIAESEKLKDVHRQSIIDNLDPEFKRKVQNLYEFAEQPHPSNEDWTRSIVPSTEHLVHYADNDPSFDNLTPYAKDYLNKNFETIGGVRLGTGETITLGSKPMTNATDIKYFIEPDKRPIVETVMERRTPVILSQPSTWSNIFEKKIPKKRYKYPDIKDEERTLLEINYTNKYSPQQVSEINAHEIGHNQQTVANWTNLIQYYDQNFKYKTNHDKNELAKAFKEAMVEPQLPGTTGRNVTDYDYETWKSGVGELHSELNMSRLNAAQYYMKQGMSMDEAIQTLKQLEADGDDELFEYYIDASGKLDKHFRPNVDFKTKKTLLQALPVVGATVLTGKKLFENEESPLPNNQRYGGNISNLQKFLR